MPPSTEELARISRLRGLFLDETRGVGRLKDYWRDDLDLQAYDGVLAARIGWKWDAALAECEDRGFARAADATVLDFGCGTGIASRCFARRFGAREVLCHDRSGAAMAFAVRALRGQSPAVAARILPDTTEVSPDVLLVSHVIGELDARGLDTLRHLIDRAQRVVIVEPGNHVTSRRLGALRDQLLASFHVVAPCPTATSCPALAQELDWCHFFASPPPEVFTDGEWVRTARALGIDLRALPYAFLALDREPVAMAPPPHRILGRPAMKSRAAVVRVCEGNELRVREVSKRGDAATFRTLKKHPETMRTLPPG